MENTVELVGVYGGDLTHALSAWTSTSRDLTEEKEQRVGKLLKFLAENKHHTPFEKSALHFLITVDTATHIQLLKHRVGVSVNGESARYKEYVQMKNYIPDDWPEELQKSLEGWYKTGVQLYQHTLNEITKSHGRKRAKESARFFLPYSNQIIMDVQFNFRSFMHFCGLRFKDDAQKEVHDLAGQMLHLVRNTGEFDESLRAFGY